ncbi:MAG: dihydrolipoyl dehydrogenase [Saprospiraceae bacterium]|nr:dihydrolipoyl dehydrogenase [Saprospiraceae bacterium]
MKVVIIGSGPGGYVAAIRCAQLGFEVTLVEKYNKLGGTCLNVGCIPSKALLDSSEHYHQLITGFEDHGIKTKTVLVDLPKMMHRKQEVVEQNTRGIKYLMKKNNINVIHAKASFKGAQELLLLKVDGSEERVEFDKCIIATGSKPNCPSSFNYNKKRIITSTEALSLNEIPKTMMIIGAGVIGIELGSVYSRLGTQVTLIEYMDKLLENMDPDCTKELLKTLEALGMLFKFGRSVQEVSQISDSKVQLSHQSKQGSEHTTEVADYVLISTGRRPYTEDLLLELAGIKTDDKGYIKVNNNLQTDNPHVYAIGDVIGGVMLAHKAEEEAVFVAEVLAGQKPEMHYHLIPNVIYTWPEMASVGFTEAQLIEKGRAFQVGKFPFKALGRARASNDLDGLVKVIADAQTDEILGVHICGARAADLIMEAVALMNFKASAEDMAMLSHAHPSFSEALKEAALDACGKRALHF